MSKPSDPVSATSSGSSGPTRQHQSHPEETEEELREHQGLSLSSSAPTQETGPLRGLVIKQEPPDTQELEERDKRERQAEQEFLFRQVRTWDRERKTKQGRKNARRRRRREREIKSE